jgi:L-ascorbate metabolism protein UlaG (beta-lactamase superfamily)
MKLTWYGHSCFKYESENCSAVFDPFRPGSVSGYKDLPELSASAVFCSHTHGDHFFPEAVSPDYRFSDMKVKRIPCFHDDCSGKKRGLNLITVVECDNMKIAHLGDLGHVPDEDILSALRGTDILMIPVGGFYTIGPETAYDMVRKISPKVCVPMHYRQGKLGYDVISELQDFLKFFAKNEVVFLSTNTVTDQDIEKGLVLIPKYME